MIKGPYCTGLIWISVSFSKLMRTLYSSMYLVWMINLKKTGFISDIDQMYLVCHVLGDDIKLIHPCSPTHDSPTIQLANIMIFTWFSFFMTCLNSSKSSLHVPKRSYNNFFKLLCCTPTKHFNINTMNWVYIHRYRCRHIAPRGCWLLAVSWLHGEQQQLMEEGGLR